MQIYLGNLAPEVDEPLLFEFVSQLAPVVSVRLPHNKASPQTHQGYGFAQFSNGADGEYVLQLLNAQPVKLFDRAVKGKPASKSASGRSRPAAPAAPPQKYVPRIFVGNLRPEVGQNLAGLRVPFAKFGAVADVQFVAPQPHQRAAHAFVTMPDAAAAAAAVSALNQQTLLDSVARVEFER